MHPQYASILSHLHVTVNQLLQLYHLVLTFYTCSQDKKKCDRRLVVHARKSSDINHIDSKMWASFCPNSFIAWLRWNFPAVGYLEIKSSMYWLSVIVEMAFYSEDICINNTESSWNRKDTSDSDTLKTFYVSNETFRHSVTVHQKLTVSCPACLYDHFFVANLT